MNKLTLGILIALFSLSFSLPAQRVQKLGRGVVACNSSSGVMVSWRRLIQDPEDATYNVYVAKAGSDTFTKLTSSPVSLTHYSTTLSQVPDGASLYVTMVDASGHESDASVPFVFHTYSIQKSASEQIKVPNAFVSVNFKQAGSPIYNQNGLTFVTKFCWPVDLDGDGEMEYIVNRIYTAKDQNGCEGWGDDHLGGDCLEAYNRQGQHLWTVNLGIHYYSFGGQNDGLTVGDFDGDGKGEVIVQLAEGARFWDAEQNTFGKYLHYNGQQMATTGSGMVTVSSDGSNPDIDGDGITNYTWYNKGKNPQWYFVVIDGLTGQQKDICAMTMPKDKDMTYTRTNKSAFMSDEYSYPSPAMGTAYLDGVHQSAVAQFQCRTSDGNHHYFTYAYGYEQGEFKEKWIFKFHDYSNLSEFHHIRIGDVDGDGKDEVMNGQCAVDHDGTLLWTSGISHGDRFRMSDIDPDHPGQEIFAIQQNAPDMLGQILYDASTGKAIKKWYLSAVGDVGRGECMDVDPAHKGYEMWSTMPNIYNAKGDQIGTEKPYPYEGIWWDGDLGRESVMTSGSGNNCPVIIAKYNKTATWSRIFSISSETSWTLAAENAVRAMFWGDIYGDWREEIILKQIVGGEECGFVGLTTAVSTSVKNIYCLLQDPNYYGQITNRGYYQSPNTSFYLGYDMPRPPLPPFIQPDADNAVYGLVEGNATVTLPSGKKNLYVMPVKGQTLQLEGNLSGTTDLWKSQQGEAILLGNNLSAGRTIISEGTLQVAGTVAGTVELRARGTLSGSGQVGGISFEGALNCEGGRILPTGTLTVNGNLSFNQISYVELDLGKSCLLSVQGDLSVSQTTYFTILLDDVQEGLYPLVRYTGSFSGSLDKFVVRGLTGISYDIVDQDGMIQLRINGQRSANSGVVWRGTEGNVWDYKQQNWSLGEEPTAFVASDSVLFNNQASITTINIPDLMPVGQVEVQSSRNYTFQGAGGLSGAGSLIKSGTGNLYLNCTKSDYTGATYINEGTVTVKDLADGGIPSCLGAASSKASNFQMGKATLVVNNSNSATNRGMTLNDTATIQISSGTMALKGVVQGNGLLRKTGAGQLNITYAGNNTWAGTILQAGTLAMGCWNTTFGKAGSNIHVTGNASIVMFDANSTSTIPNFGNVLEIDSAKTCTFQAGSRCTIKGSLKGKGIYKISFPYVRGDVYTNCSDFEGTYHVATSNCRFIQAMDLSKATLYLASGAYASGMKSGSGTAASFTHKVGSLTGTGTLGTGVWNVGYRNEDCTFGGVVEAGSSLNKYGTGTLSLTGTSAAPVTVYAGTVLASNTSTAVTTGMITVNAGASLAGKGKAAQVTVKKGGEVSAGVGASSREFITIDELTLQSGAVLHVGFISSGEAAASTGDQFKVKTVKMTSPIFRIESKDGSEIGPESQLQVFSGATSITLTGTITIEPECPCEGYVWDTSTLLEDGYLRLSAVNGIRSVDSDVHSDHSLYDLYGRKLNHRPSGLYIRNGKLVK